MKTTIPRPQIILDYETYFGEAPPDDRISLIKHVSKDNILYEFAALNYRLKPKDKIHVDNSFETQIKELKYFTQYFTPNKEVFIKYSKVIEKYVNSKDYFPIIFNRQACLFAIEEIINSDEMHIIDDFVMARIEVWEAILKYYLAVNFVITQFKDEKDNNNVSFESLNPKLLPLNELSIETDPIFTPYRGYWLIDYMLKRSILGDELKLYFRATYEIEPEQFVYHLLGMYMSNHREDPDHNFFYSIKDGYNDLYERLSIRNPNKDIYKLLNIRKSPFINVGYQKYLIADNSFLLEKAYSQLLNDFWFDWIKMLKDEEGNPKFLIKFYRGVFGHFFEQYLSQLLIKSFENFKYSTLLMFNQLELKIGKKLIEIADVYLRYGNKIILGQVKSGNIYDSEKYGGSKDLLYKNDRNKFFENFGVNQLIKSLTNMDDYIQLVDSKFPKGHTYEVYPCIIINDKALQTPLMADTFNIRFQELLKDFHIKKVNVRSLTVIHINDLERLEDTLNKNPILIWELLQFNHRVKSFIPPFYDTVNKKLTGRHYPKRILKLFKSIILNHNTEGEKN